MSDPTGVTTMALCHTWCGTINRPLCWTTEVAELVQPFVTHQLSLFLFFYSFFIQSHVKRNFDISIHYLINLILLYFLNNQFNITYYIYFMYLHFVWYLNFVTLFWECDIPQDEFHGPRTKQIFNFDILLFMHFKTLASIVSIFLWCYLCLCY